MGRAAPPRQPASQNGQPPPLPKETEPLRAVSLSDLDKSDVQSLTSYERAKLSLLEQNFDLIFKQVDRWIAISRQRDQEMELTLGKVRAFAELAERMVAMQDSALEKLVTLEAALIVAIEQIQNPQGNQGG